MTEPLIIPGAEPFYFPGGPVGCILVHGFTGAPKEMRSLGEYLHEQGHTVLGLRLAGHGTSIKDMSRMDYTDWLASVEDGYYLLKPNTKKIFLMGLSMGGVLSLTLAARLDIDGVVAMSTPYQMPVEWIRKYPWLLSLVSRVVKETSKSEGNWFTPEAAENHISYEKNPTRPAYQLYRLLKVMQESLPEIKVPALVIHSQDDDYVPVENAKPLFEAIGSPEKEFVLTDHASHVITRDGDVMRVFKPIEAFIQKYSG